MTTTKKKKATTKLSLLWSVLFLILSIYSKVVKIDFIKHCKVKPTPTDTPCRIFSTVDLTDLMELMDPNLLRLWPPNLELLDGPSRESKRGEKVGFRPSLFFNKQ